MAFMAGFPLTRGGGRLPPDPTGSPLIVEQPKPGQVEAPQVAGIPPGQQEIGLSSMARATSRLKAICVSSSIGAAPP
jgi:hypothetical protein